MNTFLTRPMRLAACFSLSLFSSLAAWGQLPPAESASPVAAASLFENCRPLTDKAMAVDLQAATAQAQKRELSE